MRKHMQQSVTRDTYVAFPSESSCFPHRESSVSSQFFVSNLKSDHFEELRSALVMFFRQRSTNTGSEDNRIKLITIDLNLDSTVALNH